MGDLGTNIIFSFEMKAQDEEKAFICSAMGEFALKLPMMTPRRVIHFEFYIN